MKSILMSCLVCLLVPAMIATAEETGPPAAAASPLTESSKSVNDGMQKIILRSAELMPESEYGFRPVDSVRSFGAIVGHIADSQYAFCSAVRGEKTASLQIEKTKSTKAELAAALAESFAYCNEVWADMTDASGIEDVHFMGADRPKLTVLSINGLHTIEHYGNLVTYLRMKGLVPPTSDPEFMKTVR